MDKATRNVIERATQQTRRLLDEDFSSQLEGTFDIMRSGVIASKGGAHLSALELFKRDKIVAAIEHKRAVSMSAVEAIEDYVRDAAFTTLNRFVALKMLETRELVQECITKGEQSAGYREFCGMAPGVPLLPDAAGYRLYIESLFDEFSTEIKVLFDRRDAASVLWPKRQTFEALVAILNAQDLSGVWGEDETIGWVYQFFNSSEERKKMRDESQAPRNSRELAVRNQFFTPRYVVQFLTDNTLGRLWLEMHGDETRLANFCEYLVRSIDESAATRPRKDPRDLRILDPACGSGHFLLYSFDLLLIIYEEAWFAEGATPRSDATGRTLRDEYPTLSDLRRAAPRLIVERNLYGVDVDPRCAQIAAWALWLRAQRAWNELGIAASERPRIHQTHIVVAEPMPGDRVLVEEFATRLDPPLLRDLFKKMVAESHLAGELGTLLRLEDGIAVELHRAREQFVKHGQTTDFLPDMEPVPKQGALDLSGIDNDGFFHEAETRIIEALRGFAETAIGGASVRRKLFVGDAAQGIALIDLVRTRFDVVLMNPPFGDPPEGAKSYIFSRYGAAKTELYAAFIDRSLELAPTGFIGCLASRTGFFLTSLERWRRASLLGTTRGVTLFLDLGDGVLDAAVECAAIIISGSDDELVCGDARDPFRERRLEDIRIACASDQLPDGWSVTRRSVLRKLPGATFAYRLPPSLVQLFAEFSSLAQSGFIAKQGIGTSDNFRFLRLRWEVAPHSDSRWWRYSKGGGYSPYFVDSDLVLNWHADGSEVKAYSAQLYGSWSKQITNTQYFGMQGLTYASRTHRELAPAFQPAYSAFDTKGCCIFSEREFDQSVWLTLLGLMNSRMFAGLLRVGLARATSGLARQYTESLILSMPVPDVANVPELSRLVGQAHSLHASIEAAHETSSVFDASPWIAIIKQDASHAAIEQHRQALRSTWESQILSSEMIDALACKAYFRGHTIPESISSYLDSEVGRVPAMSEDIASSGYWHPMRESSYFVAKEDPALETRKIAQALLSVTVGKLAKRWASHSPSERESRNPANDTRASGILFVDDEGHEADIVARLRHLFQDGESSSAEATHERVSELASDCGRGIRGYFRQEFFAVHLQNYSSSKRRAPVYWQISTPSLGYSVWLYFHAFTKDTLFSVQTDYAGPKLEHERKRLDALRTEGGSHPNAPLRKAIGEQQGFVDELQGFIEELKLVAPLWCPTLDDGVIINFAPLWRLVPQHKSWQRELKTTWGELTAGKYDWAHLAMHLWPERVIPKCATDHSLAIAHGLEAVFWAEGDDGKWKPRPAPTHPVDELVRERTSTAVKAALKSLIEAPAAITNGGRRRESRIANAVSDGGAR
jgi:23S rRNA G2445 N2-methylase RlmL